jgi:hypothetical protein
MNTGASSTCGWTLCTPFGGVDDRLEPLPASDARPGL